MRIRGGRNGSQTPEAPHVVPALALRRDVAGKEPMWRGLEIVAVTALAALIAAGAAVAGTNAKDHPTGEAATAIPPAAVATPASTIHGTPAVGPLNAGTTDAAGLSAYFDLTLLNTTLLNNTPTAAGGVPVPAAGLGTE